jgi:2-polyprenyl-3-methyl-5-hydroxy-6-metoxy-1,4-benzoquinol methylase
MIDLSKRSFQTEIMDDFNLPAGEVEPVLKGLDLLNRLSGGNRAVISALAGLTLQNDLVIADWGCGGGGMLRAIASWAVKKRLKIQLKGLDATPAAIAYAEGASAGFDNITFTQADVLIRKLEENEADIVYSSLFSHHFNDHEWVSLVNNMLLSARRAVIITDLHRHWLSYYGVVLISALLTRNKMAQNDGPLSVRRSFTKPELVALLKQTDALNYRIRWRWAFRWEVVILKSTDIRILSR